MGTCKCEFLLATDVLNHGQTKGSLGLGNFDIRTVLCFNPVPTLDKELNSALAAWSEVSAFDLATFYSDLVHIRAKFP